uniref:Uncharacterized protein n=1 Tax=Astyanax mexicanus TaxID=7994 RepID=A0A3B1IF78_ASTMX
MKVNTGHKLNPPLQALHHSVKYDVLSIKDEKDHPDCYQQQVQKSRSVMYTEVLEQHMLPSRTSFLCMSIHFSTRHNNKPHAAHKDIVAKLQNGKCFTISLFKECALNVT